jgi:hypothetical protein
MAKPAISGSVVHGLELHHHHTHSALRADELRDQRSQKGIDDAEIEPGENQGQTRRQLNEPERLPAAGVQRRHQLQPVAVDRQKALQRVEQYREHRQRRRHGDLGFDLVAEPNDVERRDSDLGQALDRRDIGKQQPFDRAKFCHGRGEHQTERAADDETGERRLKRILEVIPESGAVRGALRQPVGQCDQHRARRWQHVGWHLKKDNGDLPQHEPDHQAADQ